MTHTILLWQTEKKDQSKHWKDFQNVSAAIDFFINMFEVRLQALNPHLNDITYDINDLFLYIDTLPDLCALVLDHASYVPRTKDWIKQEVYTHLGRQTVGGNPTGRRGTARRR